MLGLHFNCANLNSIIDNASIILIVLIVCASQVIHLEDGEQHEVKVPP
jgi:hypothetical protein